MQPLVENLRYAELLRRRAFLGHSALGFGASALGTLLSQNALGWTANDDSRNKLPHHPPRVKRVIFLYMSGGPSHLETFDYKPELARLNDQPMPESFTAGQPIAQLQGQKLKCLGPQFKFSRCGKSGQEIADILPYTQKVADDICIIRSMQTDQINHDPAHSLMNTGTSISGRQVWDRGLTMAWGASARIFRVLLCSQAWGDEIHNPFPNANGEVDFCLANTKALNSIPKGMPFITSRIQLVPIAISSFL